MNKRIMFTGINKSEIVEQNIPVINNNDDILIKTAFSCISPGTERANITGDPNVSIYSDGIVRFPRVAGYSSSGEVLQVGANVTDVKVGDKVAVSWSSHSQYNIVHKNNYVVIPEGVSLKEAAFCHIGTFPLAAIRKTRLEIGESAMVMGLGLLGILAVKFAKLSGAVPVIAVDPVKERRDLALQFGADYTFDPYDADFAEKVKKVTGDGVNVAIEVTGSGAGLNECLDCMARFGRVALLGCTRDKNFTVDYYRKVHGPGISLIGAHTMARPSVDSAPGMFTQKDDVKSILKMLQYKRLSFAEFIAENNSPLDCAEVYTRLINDRDFPVFVQFDWSKM